MNFSTCIQVVNAPTYMFLKGCIVFTLLAIGGFTLDTSSIWLESRKLQLVAAHYGQNLRTLDRVYFIRDRAKKEPSQMKRSNQTGAVDTLLRPKGGRLRGGTKCI